MFLSRPECFQQPLQHAQRGVPSLRGAPQVAEGTAARPQGGRQAHGGSGSQAAAVGLAEQLSRLSRLVTDLGSRVDALEGGCTINETWKHQRSMVICSPARDA